MKKCPYCAEKIKDEAVFCRYCKKDLIQKNLNNNSSKKTIKGKLDSKSKIKKFTLITLLIVTTIFLIIVYRGVSLRSNTSGYFNEVPTDTSTLDTFLFGNDAVECKSNWTGEIIPCWDWAGCDPNKEIPKECRLNKTVIDGKINLYLIIMAVVDAFILSIGFFILYAQKSKEK